MGSPVLLSPLNRLKGLYSNGESPVEQSTILPRTSQLGEFYAGFLLLPDGAPVPPTVKYPERGMPTFCGVGAGRDGPESTAVIKSFSTVTDLAREVAFPLYTLSKLSEELHLAGANLIQHKTGEVFAAVVDFQSHNRRSGDWETTVSIWAQPEFPRPFPLWSSDAVEPDGPAVILEKVDFLPSPGVIVATPQGAVFHWINDDVLYTLIAELGPQETLTLASSLSLATKRRIGRSLPCLMFMSTHQPQGKTGARPHTAAMASRIRW